MELDTGSHLSTINANELKKLPNITVKKTAKYAKGYGNSAIKFLGETELNFRYGKYVNKHKFYVVSKDSVSLLGRDICSKMNIKFDMANVNTVQNSVLCKYKDYLSDDFKSCPS